MSTRSTGGLSVSLLLGASLILAGCAADPQEQAPPPGVAGPVAEVAAASDWDPDKNPEYAAVDDYVAAISSRYSTWAPGSSWRFSGDGWEPKAEVLVSVVSPASSEAPETVVGEAVKVTADEFGQFADAYPVPDDAEPSEGYRLQAVSESDGRMESSMLNIVKR